MRNKSFYLFIIIFFIFFLSGCGKKGLPVPPLHERPVAVDNLSYDIKNGTLWLRWTVLVKNSKTDPAGSIVLRSRKKINKSACKDCPLRFEQVADISAKRAKAGMRFKYQERLQKGYQYTYKIYVYSQIQTKSRVSNIVEFFY